MNKALEILKNCRAKGQKRAGGIDLDEAIAELEEAMNLTRREWYQKGFNEAMKTKTCEGCSAYDDKNGDCKEDVRIANVKGIPATFYCKWYEPKE